MHGQVFDIRHKIEVTPYTPMGITHETIFWWVQFSRESHMWNISICSNPQSVDTLSGSKDEQRKVKI